MSGKFDLKLRTKNFAYSCINLCAELNQDYLSKHIKGQLIRCSSSVAANYRATGHAQSKAGFIAKMSIVVEECDECEFWLQMIMDMNLMDEMKVKSILKEGNELTSIFVSAR